MWVHLVKWIYSSCYQLMFFSGSCTSILCTIAEISIPGCKPKAGCLPWPNISCYKVYRPVGVYRADSCEDGDRNLAIELLFVEEFEDNYGSFFGPAWLGWSSNRSQGLAGAIWPGILDAQRHQAIHRPVAWHFIRTREVWNHGRHSKVDEWKAWVMQRSTHYVWVRDIWRQII